MSNHYIGMVYGKEGFKISDFTLGASSTGSTDVEVRIADLDGQSRVPTRKNIVILLKGVIRALESGALVTTFPPL